AAARAASLAGTTARARREGDRQGRKGSKREKEGQTRGEIRTRGEVVVGGEGAAGRLADDGERRREDGQAADRQGHRARHEADKGAPLAGVVGREHLVEAPD